MVRLFTAPQRFVTYVFIPWISVEFSDSKRAVPEVRHHASEIRSATRFHFFGLAGHRICLCIAEDARRRRVTASPNRIACGDANRACSVCSSKGNSSSHQAIEVRGATMLV